jgi:hypothetical protein
MSDDRLRPNSNSNSNELKHRASMLRTFSLVIFVWSLLPPSINSFSANPISFYSGRQTAISLKWHQQRWTRNWSLCSKRMRPLRRRRPLSPFMMMFFQSCYEGIKDTKSNVSLEVPPGPGKTTIVPSAMLHRHYCSSK